MLNPLLNRGFLSSLSQSAKDWQAELHQVYRQHRHASMGAMALVLASLGTTALAQLELNTFEVETAQVVEVLPLSPVGAADSSQTAHDELRELPLFTTVVTQTSDTPASLLRRLQVQDSEALRFLLKDPAARGLFEGKSSKIVSVSTDRFGLLTELVARFAPENEAEFNSHFQRLTVRRQADTFSVQHDKRVALQVEQRMASGLISAYRDFYRVADAAQVPAAVSDRVVSIFESSVNFQQGLNQGDSFKIIWESLSADGHPVAWVQSQKRRGARTPDGDGGRVLAAEIVSQGTTHSAVWFAGDKGSAGQYVDRQGRSLRKAYLASPLQYTRISSTFGGRFHPIRGERHQHSGVDYVAATGTPVRSVAQGTVLFSGVKGGYGNVIEVLHPDGKSTVYAHLSRTRVRTGQKVAQGLHIGDVGSTGASTGPHLHFEFKQGSTFLDPMQVARQSTVTPLSAEAKLQAKATAAQKMAKLSKHDPLERRGAHFE